MVDTEQLRSCARMARHTADILADDRVIVTPELLDKIADEIDSLLAQLAEAKANAIPWRDGPARGGEMPTEERLKLAIVASYDPSKIVIGTTKLLEGKMAVLNIYTGAEHKRILSWCYESDLLPAKAEESGVAE